MAFSSGLIFELIHQPPQGLQLRQRGPRPIIPYGLLSYSLFIHNFTASKRNTHPPPFSEPDDPTPPELIPLPCSPHHPEDLTPQWVVWVYNFHILGIHCLISSILFVMRLFDISIQVDMSVSLQKVGIPIAQMIQILMNN
jgi:hypothetical protein